MRQGWNFDRFLRYDELSAWLSAVAAAHPGLAEVSAYGSSFEGRDLLLVTLTDRSTGAPEDKPALWVDGSIHAVELSATVACAKLIDHLLSGWDAGDERVREALQTRTFYVAPRVNPDGAEWVLADRPRHRRSSVRPWPWPGGRAWPGLTVEDVDGDGRILQMRLADLSGGWMAHPEDARLMTPVPLEGCPSGTPRYRLLVEGRGVDLDGWTLPTPRSVEGLDLNRNFPAGWGRGVTGSGDHPLSEPEVDALVRAIVARPNICGYNAFHTSGGVLLRPSSTRPDSKLKPFDRWAWTELGAAGTRHTGYPVHSVYEDFTWDPDDTISGAADDWVYEHLGLLGWTTELWDVIHAATGNRASTKSWYLGPAPEEALAVLRWVDANHRAGFVDWYTFDHPDLGPVELGGWDELAVWTNPPPSLLEAEVEPHARFAVDLALAAPRLVIGHTAAVSLGDSHWRVEVGVANDGWLPTAISAHAESANLVLPVTVEIGGDGVEVVGEPVRRTLGQLAGRSALRFRGGHDGSPDRALATWTVRANPGSVVDVTARHPRAGVARAQLTLPLQSDR